MKSSYINMLIVSLLLLSVMAGLLIIFLWDAGDKFPDEIVIRENGVTESILPVRDLMLNPTESKEYSVDLICQATGLYNISLSCEEREDGGMKHFVDVAVLLDGELLFEGALVDLIDGGEVVTFQEELDDVDPIVLTLRYSMPYETGNEAQGTFANFDAQVSIKKQ